METPSLNDLEGKVADGKPTKVPSPLTMKELANGKFPAPLYVVNGLILEACVNLLYGDGGVGKSTVSTQIGVAVAAGLPIFGRKTRQRHVILVGAEDDYGVLKERIAAQCKVLGVKLEDLPLTPWCLPGEIITLAKISDDGKATKEPFYNQLAELIREHPGALVVLDSLIDIADLSEKDRAPANTLMKKVLGSYCKHLGATILVLGHPSKAAMQDGSWHSGSTSFRNSVRVMLAMKHVKDSKGFRTLEVSKSNYAAPDEIKLMWKDGIFHSLDAQEVKKNEAVKTDLVMSRVLNLIDDGKQVSRSNRSDGYNPKALAKQINKECDTQITQQEVTDILLVAEADKVISYVKRYGNTPAHYVRRKPGEDFTDAPVDHLLHPVSEIEIPEDNVDARLGLE